MNYLGRNQWVLQQGTVKTDLAFYLYEAPYTVATQFQRSNLENLGYTYEYLGPANFQLPTATVSNGVLAEDGPAYKALIFSNQTVIGLTAAQSLLKFAQQGLPIFFIGQPPNQARSASNAIEAQTMGVMQQVLAVSGNVHRLSTAADLPSALAGAGVHPRTRAMCSSSSVYTAWRSANETEYVFIFNDQNEAASCTFTFTTAQRNAVPYALDAWTGDAAPLFIFMRPSPDTISAQMTLAANETAMFAFMPPSSASKDLHIRSASSNITSISVSSRTFGLSLSGNANLVLSNSTSVNFTAAPPQATSLTHFNLSVTSWHGPTNVADRFEVRTEKTNYSFNNITLQPWSAISPSIRNVSGVGRYTTTFTTPRSTTSNPLGAILSLPLIQHTAHSYLNAHQLPPFDPVKPMLDISAYLSPTGQHNHLMIEVTTTLSNAVRAAALKGGANGPLFIGTPIGEIGNYTAVPVAKYGLIGHVGVEWVEMVTLRL